MTGSAKSGNLRLWGTPDFALLNPGYEAEPVVPHPRPRERALLASDPARGRGAGYKKSFNAPVIWLRGPAPPEKIFLFSLAANHRLIRAIPPHKRGVCAIVRKCEAGSGGRDASGAILARTNDAARTAKSCGPDARMLASSSWEANAFRGRWCQEAPIHQGEHDIGRKTIAQGRPDCFR